jgi:hypothetical protein
MSHGRLTGYLRGLAKAVGETANNPALIHVLVALLKIAPRTILELID